jgi:hypothetical protein
LFAGRNRRLTEARKVQRDSPIAGLGERLEVFGPHRAVRDARMEQHNGRPTPDLVVRKRHSQPVSATRESERETIV